MFDKLLNLLGAALEHIPYFHQKGFLPGRRGRRGGDDRHGHLLQRVHDFDDHENAESDYGEVDHSVDERSVGDDGRSGFLRLSQGFDIAEPSLASFAGSRLMKRSAKFTPPMIL